MSRPFPPLLALSWCRAAERRWRGRDRSDGISPRPVMAGPTPPAGISRALIVERSLGEEDERNVYELSFRSALSNGYELSIGFEFSNG